MGSNMSRRWLPAGHSVVGYARHAETVHGLLADKVISAGATSEGPYETMSSWTAATPTTSTTSAVSGALAAKEISYLDWGTSGGIAGRLPALRPERCRALREDGP
jgi:6-phosphogluconate dehydrogenase (decarboxylating)